MHARALTLLLLGLALGVCAASAAGFAHARNGAAACDAYYVHMSGYTASNAIPASSMPDCGGWHAAVDAAGLLAYFSFSASVALATGLAVVRLRERAGGAAA